MNTHFPLNAAALAVITIPHIGATDDDAVRVCETDGTHTMTYSECWFRPESEYLLKRGHADDFALANALASHMDDWPDNRGKSAEELIAQAESFYDNYDFGCP